MKFMYTFCSCGSFITATLSIAFLFSEALGPYFGLSRYGKASCNFRGITSGLNTFGSRSIGCKHKNIYYMNTVQNS